jgi:ADP-ribosylglycohydrolase
MHDALDLRELLGDEIIQRQESGYDLEAVLPEVRAALTAPGPAWSAELEGAYHLLESTTVQAGWTYVEPAGLAGILASLPRPDAAQLTAPGDRELSDRLHGAWLGRCAGCNLGKPVEGHGWNRRKLRTYLEQAGAYPIDDYLPVLDPMPDGMELNGSWREATRGRVNAMARDDDIDYTILGLHVLEGLGPGFTTADIGREWLRHLPFTQTYTAERAAYRNLVRGIEPTATATTFNPYREWIGAMIRGDAFGYVSPGRPDLAAGLAYADAALSHVGNGVYGEMWAAALIAISLSVSSARDALDLSLAYVPPQSRLAQALTRTRASFDAGLSWDQAMERIEADLGHYHWIHTINNAAVVAAALLWGEGDFSRTIGLAVEGGLDTDCTGATAGSAFGALHGSAALPGVWVDPLHDLMHSAISGFDNSRIADLAARTATLARQFSQTEVPAPGDE